jgi:AcrR family transcriptional regulator
MADPVKTTRRYESPRRREQAAATRKEILGAAQRLFERQGYAATTMAAVAAEAGVALKTVYVAFETKSGLLRALWHLVLRGDEGDVPMGERPWYREVLAEPEPERQLRQVARTSCLVKRRAGALMQVIRDAAPVDPDLAALWQRIQTEFHGLLRPVAESLSDRHALRPGLDVERATDILWALNHPDLWQLLVRQRDWTPERFEEWLTGALLAELLTPEARSAR